MNSCFEGLEGRMGLNRVREFIPKMGKKRNELDETRRGAFVMVFGYYS